MKVVEISPNLFHVGPPLEHGPLPSLFYFALSGPDSLSLDPINQPVQYLRGKPIRVFSMSLPAHEEGRAPQDALASWSSDIAKGIDPLSDFFEEALSKTEYLIEQEFIDPHKLGIAGLSRGGFVASHIAAREERFQWMVQFAPLTRLAMGKDFEHIKEHPHLHSLDVFRLAKQLSNRHIRFYIGNQDTRVGTRSCFDFAMSLVEHSSLRSPQIELIMTPSIGQMGHGTSTEAFHEGAAWLARHLL